MSLGPLSQGAHTALRYLGEFAGCSFRGNVAYLADVIDRNVHLPKLGFDVLEELDCVRHLRARMLRMPRCAHMTGAACMSSVQACHAGLNQDSFEHR